MYQSVVYDEREPQMELKANDEKVVKKTERMYLKIHYLFSVLS